jgi:hypothetical protein
MAAGVGALVVNVVGVVSTVDDVVSGGRVRTIVDVVGNTGAYEIDELYTNTEIEAKSAHLFD